MKKLLLVLGCAVLLAGCAQKPAMEETTEEVATGAAEVTGAVVEETATETTTTETTTTTDTTATDTTTDAAAATGVN